MAHRASARIRALICGKTRIGEKTTCNILYGAGHASLCARTIRKHVKLSASSGDSQEALSKLRRLSAQESLRKLSTSSQETLSSGISQKALRKLSGDFQEAFSKLSGDSQLRNLSGNSHEALRRLSAQESLRKLSGSFRETLSSGISQKAFRKLSGDFQEAFSKPS